MYELTQVSKTCYYIQSPAKIGLVRTGQDEACLIDSGNDKDAGKKVKRILDSNGWSLRAVYCTHSHADHIGGNRYLQSQTGCKVYAPGIERDFTEHPILEPSFLYGANPPADLKHKFLMAQNCEALPLTDACLPDGIQMIPLPGHSWDMTGFRTSDNIVYLADCLSSRNTLDKYRIVFLVDVQSYLDTLESVRSMEAELFVPSHAEPTDQIAPLAEYNIEMVHETADEILRICTNPVSFETILKQLFDRYDLTMNFEQHVLVGSTVRSYLAWLKDRGLLDAVFQGNTLLWTSHS